jgi:2-dehydro-3-deoxyphosphogluconate aldolase/(4S)-4-hydroxy-2-oxoglutarate aldolase
MEDFVNVLEELTYRRVLAIVRADSADRAVRCVRTLVGAGITALEVSLTTPGALDAIARARAECDPCVLLGAGTVLTAADADAAAAAGAAYIVTPAITAGARHAVELGLPLLCGALTPTEVISALDLGAMAVKIFPAGTHGPRYIRELRAPLPTAPLIAVGGIGADSAAAYLAAGACAVGVGSPLLAEAGFADGEGVQSALAARATTLLTAVGAPVPAPGIAAAPADRHI